MKRVHRLVLAAFMSMAAVAVSSAPLFAGDTEQKCDKDGKPCKDGADCKKENCPAPKK